MGKDPKGRSERKARKIDGVKSNDGSVVVENGNNAGTDRYHINVSDSAPSEDSTHGRGSEQTSGISQNSSEDESSAGSSFDTESDYSSLLELGADTEEMLDDGMLFSLRSLDSKPSIVGGWLDFACGWMDRPNMCVGLGGGSKQTSLLRESSLKASKVMRRVKLNDALKKSTDSAAVPQEKRKKSDVEKIQRDVAKAAMVAAASVKKHEIQPPVASMPGQVEQEPSPKRNESRMAQRVEEGQMNEDLEAKMKQVSARAAEILKNTIEARVIKASAEENARQQSNLQNTSDSTHGSSPIQYSQRDRSPTPKYSSSAHLRQKVIEQLTKDQEDSSLDEERAEPSDPPVRQASPIRVLPSNIEEHVERSKRSSRSTHSVLPIQENGSKSLTPQPVIPEDAPATSPEVSAEEEKNDVSEEQESYDQASSLPEKEVTEIHDADEMVQSSEHPIIVPASHSITDLTQFDDGQTASNHDQTDRIVEQVENNDGQNEISIPAQGSADPESEQVERPTLSHKQDPVQRDVKVIDVLELDDQDSWTPAEPMDTLVMPSLSHPAPEPISNRLADNRSPSRSNRASLFEAHVPSMRRDHSYDWNSRDQASKRLERKRAEQAKQSEALKQNEVYNDPDAREAFAGLRRGRLEVSDGTHGLPSNSKFNTRGRQDMTETRQSSLPIHRLYDEDNEFGYVSETHKPSDVIASEVALRRARSRDSRRDPRQPTDMSMEIKRRTVEATTASTTHPDDDHWKADASSRRSRHLVAVRSIDEAQRMKNERSRDVIDSNLYPSKNRDKSDFVPHAYRSPGSRESSRDIVEYSESRPRHPEVLTRMDRTYNHPRYDSSRHPAEPTMDRDQDYVERRESRDRREQEVYSTSMVNHSKSRESHTEYMDDRGLHVRGRDTRDDNDSRYLVGRRESSVHNNRMEQGGGEYPVRNRERKSRSEESEQLKELRKLEKKISKQLKQVKQEKYISTDDGKWDERSAVSVKQLRHLEKKLVQTLRAEDEKRAAKLQRIRSKKAPTRGKQLTDEPLTVRYEARSEMLSHHRSASPVKDVDLPDTRSKYNQLKFLRQSGQMRKYMQRTSTRPDVY